MFDTLIVLPKGTDDQFLDFLKSEAIPYYEFNGPEHSDCGNGLMSKLRRHWQKAKSEYAMLRKLESIGIKNSVVHVELLPTQSLVALIWLCFRTRVFLTLHNAQGPVPKWRWALWKVKFGIISCFPNLHLISTNEHAVQYFSRLFSKRLSNEIKISYSCINSELIDEVRRLKFDRRSVLQNYNISENKFVVLTVGQFVDRKGRWTLLDAAKIIASQTDEIVFIWVSPSTPDDQAQKKLMNYGLDGSFRLVRSADIGRRKEIIQFYRVADIFALPSYIEGLPLALLEAMAIGIPAVSTNVFGIPEAIENEQTGFLVEAGDSSALAAMILRLFSNGALRRRVSEKGREYVVNKFDETISARVALEAYNSAYNLKNERHYASSAGR